MPALPLPRLAALAAALATGLVAATPALAHHAMDGETPSTLAQGLLSGLAHPVIGLDHLAALVGVGLLSARFARGLGLPAIWVAAMVIGVGLHLRGLTLPFAEGFVALSLVAIGAAAAFRPTLPLAAAAALFAAAGLAHGYALGESIVGAEPAPLAAYLVGLGLVQAAITTGVALLARRLAAPTRDAAPAALRLAGLAIAAGGVAALALPGLA